MLMSDDSAVAKAWSSLPLTIQRYPFKAFLKGSKKIILVHKLVHKLVPNKHIFKL